MAFKVVKYLYYFSMILFFIAIDQMVKAYISISGFYVKNTEFIFNKFLDLSYSNSLFLFVILNIFLSFVFFILVSYLKISEQYKFWIVVFVMSGMVSNIIDRIIKTHVVDYIKIFNKVFNIADIFIFIGTFILIYFIFNKLIISWRKFNE